jgi:hypothetical protein
VKSPLLGLCLLAGCSAQLGAHVGRSTQHADPVHARGDVTWGSHVAGVIMPEPMLVGADLEGRAEGNDGSRWTIGARVGLASQPDRRPGSVGYELHADVGTRVQQSALFADGNFYAGGTVALPIWASRGHEFADLNRAQWFLVRAFEIVPYARTRWYFEHPADNRQMRQELVLGCAVRLRVVSDFLF